MVRPYFFFSLFLGLSFLLFPLLAIGCSIAPATLCFLLAFFVCLFFFFLSDASFSRALRCCFLSLWIGDVALARPQLSLGLYLVEGLCLHLYMCRICILSFLLVCNT